MCITLKNFSIQNPWSTKDEPSFSPHLLLSDIKVMSILTRHIFEFIVERLFNILNSTMTTHAKVVLLRVITRPLSHGPPIMHGTSRANGISLFYFFSFFSVFHWGEIMYKLQYNLVYNLKIG